MSEEKALNRLYKELRLDLWYKDYHNVAEDGSIPQDRMDIWDLEDRLPRTQMYAAQAIADKFKNRVTYVAATETWHIWNGCVHLPCEKGDQLGMKLVSLFFATHRDALAILKDKYDADAKFALNASGVDEKQAKTNSDNIKKEFRSILDKHIKFRDDLTKTSTKRDVITQMKEMMGVKAEYYADDRRFVVLENGYYDMDEVRATRQFVLKAHDPANPVWRYIRATEQVGAPYTELQRFLDNSIEDESQAKFYGKAIASVLFGGPTKTKTIVDLYGETDAGKSMISGVLGSLAPDHYYEASANAIVAGGKDHDRHRDDMRYARIVTFLEIKAKLDKTFVLKYTGGDVITTDKKYRNAIQWKAQGMMFVMSNDGMNIGAQEAAIADRIARIHFPHQFMEDHVDERYRKDPELDKKILAQSSGFIEWLKASYLMHLEEDLDGKIKRSDSMEMLKLEMQENGNTMSLYLEHDANLTFPVQKDGSKNKWVSFTTFFAGYKTWCKQGNFDQMDESDVKAWMKKEGLTERTNSLRVKDRVEMHNVHSRF